MVLLTLRILTEGRFEDEKLPNLIIAIAPLVIVFVLNAVFTRLIPDLYGCTCQFSAPANRRRSRWATSPPSGRWREHC